MPDLDYAHYLRAKLIMNKLSLGEELTSSERGIYDYAANYEEEYEIDSSHPDYIILVALADWKKDPTTILEPYMYLFRGAFLNQISHGLVATTELLIAGVKVYGWQNTLIMFNGGVLAENLAHLNNGVKLLKVVTAEEVNNWWLNEGYTEPPYKPETLVQEIELTAKTTFVRVYDGVNSSQAGGWIMKAEDITGLTPSQIQAKFALPHLPTHLTDVILEAGTTIRTGIANSLFGYPGGGTQFDLMGQFIGEFINGRLLP